MTNPCILWTGYTMKSGHGQTWRNGKQDYVHRLAYIDAYGPIPEGLQVNHRCPGDEDHPNCIEPTHLYAGTQKENLDDIARRRGSWPTKPRSTHCPKGHEKTPENTYEKDRSCMVCRRARSAVSNAKRAALRSA